MGPRKGAPSGNIFRLRPPQIAGSPASAMPTRVSAATVPLHTCAGRRGRGDAEEEQEPRGARREAIGNEADDEDLQEEDENAEENADYREGREQWKGRGEERVGYEDDDEGAEAEDKEEEEARARSGQMASVLGTYGPPKRGLGGRPFASLPLGRPASSCFSCGIKWAPALAASPRTWSSFPPPDEILVVPSLPLSLRCARPRAPAPPLAGSWGIGPHTHNRRDPLDPRSAAALGSGDENGLTSR